MSAMRIIQTTQKLWDIPLLMPRVLRKVCDCSQTVKSNAGEASTTDRVASVPREAQRDTDNFTNTNFYQGWE